ncbi:MAG: hypothetical protein KDA29_10820 [Phycisphaerales bacterium]|nr:hypothetical protein [Phycisphaerales bacterium]
MSTDMILKTTLALIALSGGVVQAEVPTYSVDVVSAFTQTTNIRGASDTGLIVGDQIVNGVSRAFIASQGNGITLLPLPNGAMSSIAMDVNKNGMVVGAVHGGGFVVDGGEPAIWVPDGNGGYEAYIPEQFETLPSPIGTLPSQGGMATAVNDDGVVLGWSRYFGFQGGPAMQFSIDQPPINLALLGFQAAPEDLNNNNIAVGGNYTFDLNTNTVTHIGVPAPVGTVGFTHVLGYAINDSEQVVAAAHIATSTNNQWVTYIYDGDWSPLYPNQVGTRFVGFVYDNNNLGDVSAWGGVYFAPEDAWFGSYDQLIDPADQNWDTDIGYIGNDRRVYTTAFDASTNTNAIVVLVPDTGVCPADLTGDGALDFFDVSAFLNAYNAMNPIADLTGDGNFDFFDVSAFLNAFSAGCP